MSKRVPQPNFGSFTESQKRASAVAVILAVLFGAYFLRGFFILISVAAIMAFLFLPLYKRLHVKLSSGASAAITFFAALLIVLLPLIGIVLLAAEQVRLLIDAAGSWMYGADLGELGDRVLNFINSTLERLPYVTAQLTQADINTAIANAASSVGNWLLNSASGIAGSFFGLITTAILFIYVFLSLLVNHKKVAGLLQDLNPMGPEVSRMYMQKAGDMVHGAVGGQFVIALLQGFTGAISLYIAGFQEAFFVLALVFTLMSMIPLGSGIITIPIGIGMVLFGNVAGGVFVVLWHILGVTNIDNILRPVLVPKSARLDPALMLVTVFAGITMFGFWGVFIGPVIMILIVSTIKVYLAVHRNIPFDQPDHPKEKKQRIRRLLRKPKAA